MKLNSKISKLFLILILIGVSLEIEGQNNEFSFSDEVGNEITIEKTELIPELIDTDFLKNNINGNHFTINKNEKPTLKFEYTIEKITQINKTEFLIRVSQRPKSNKAEDILRYSGYTNYRMKIKETKNGIKLHYFQFLNTEI